MVENLIKGHSPLYSIPYNKEHIFTEKYPEAKSGLLCSGVKS